MKKRIFAICLALSILVGIGAAFGTTGRVSKLVDYANITVSLNGKNLNLVDANGKTVEPFAIDGTTYLPIRAVGDALGLYVGWDQVNAEVKLSEAPLEPDSGITDGTVNFYLVRHGKTIMNTMDLVQGWSDSPLTDAGVEVAKNAAVGLSNIVFDYAYSSDRGRAIQTAEIILAANKTSSGLTVVTDAGLRETNFGEFEGVPNSVMWGKLAEYNGYESFMDFYKAVGAANVFVDVPNIDSTGTAESDEELLERMTASMEAITKEVAANGGGNVLLVGHGASLSSLIAELTGEAASLDNASVSKIVYKDGAYTAEFTGDMSFAENGAAIRAEQEKPVTIYLTRHGKTFFNTVGRVQGWIDSPLTEDGIAVAENLGRGLANVQFSGVYTSGMGRAVETAELVLAQNTTSKNLSIVNNPGIRETNYGKYEGQMNMDMMVNAMAYYGVSDFADMATETQSYMERYLQYCYETDETGEAENMYELRSRVSSAFEEICQEAASNGGGNILVVSHGNAIMAVLEELGITNVGDISNASVTKIVYANGVYTVESINDMTYVESGAGK